MILDSKEFVIKILIVEIDEQNGIGNVHGDRI
jgi:hypothetical protein